MTAAELAEVERRVNADIRANHGAEVRHMDMQEALDFDEMALFGAKYGERVRVLRTGDASTELCGGTHVSRPGDIGRSQMVSAVERGGAHCRTRVCEHGKDSG